MKISGNNNKLFISRINKKGKGDWIQSLYFSKPSSGYLLETDLNGNVYLGGVFSDTLKCGTQEIVSNGFNDIFIARFSPTGQIDLLKSFGGKGKDQLTAITSDNQGNLYLAGNFEQEMKIDIQTISPALNEQSSNVFLVCLDKAFKVKRVNAWFSPRYCEITGMVFNKYQNLFLTGNFSQYLQCDSVNIKSKGITDFFVSQTDTTWKVKWVKTYGTRYETNANTLLVNNFNGVMVAGSFNDSLLLDSIQLIPKGKVNNVFSAQFTSEGKVTWAENIGGKNGSGIGRGIITDKFVAKYYNCPDEKNVIECPTYICKDSVVLLSVPKRFMDVVWNDSLFGTYSVLVDKPGMYSVKMVDENGCLVKDTITIKDAPVILFSLGRDTAIAVTDILLLKGPEYDVQYQWQDNSSNKDFLVSSFNGQPGTFEYRLTLTDTIGCSWNDQISVDFYKEPEYIDLSNENDLIEIHPNPVKDNLYWSLKISDEVKLAIELSDLNGKVIKHEEIKRYFPNEQRTVNVSSLSSGSYYFSIIGRDKKVTVKIMKE
jgi:hypothetical protein